jgi:hypothetical protein
MEMDVDPPSRELVVNPDIDGIDKAKMLSGN